GLLAYPFLIEPFLDVHSQLARWAVAFTGFALSVVPACLAVRPKEAEAAPGRAARGAPATPRGARLFWLACAFVPSVMLLAATNHVTVDIAATPLLWVLPLALYLVSFIVAFGGFRSALRGGLLVLWVAGAIGLSMNAFAQGTATLSRQLGVTLVALFASCLLCHGELALERPPAHALTAYYLIIAAGGALGGVFVTLVAPLVFSDFYELELGTAATFVVLLIASRRRHEHSWSRSSRAVLLVGCGVCLPLLVGSVVVRTERETRGGRVVERRRSFLGPLRVVDIPEGRVLTHGRIQHGLELRDPAHRSMPTMYFGPGTALERVLRHHHEGQRRSIGVVGLGIGTIAAYGERGDHLRFYELDPNVVELARRDFDFLRDTRAHIEVVVGDGRLALARELPHAFDVLVLDAFSSDAVPVHLLTQEAFAIYAGHLAPDGILLVNVSNRHLAVDRVVESSARAQGLTCLFVETPSNPALHVSHVEWGIAARDPAFAALLGGLPIITPSRPEVLFTDTRASVLAIVR
ncbi:MAG TPA: fused MFS/spermidine synthase, partial [Polyangiaceae bacterium]